MDMRFHFTSPLWIWPANASWYFVTLPRDQADELRFFSSEAMSGVKRGFGSVKVEVIIGETTWKTSVFPDKKSHSFVLPVKKEVRRQEGLAAGDDVTVTLRPLGLG